MPETPSAKSNKVERRRAIEVDLSGSNCGDEFLAATVIVYTAWPDARIREEASRHYGVPLEQVGWPRQPTDEDDPYG